MNRRSFFKFLGIGAAAAVVAPKVIAEKIVRQKSKTIMVYRHYFFSVDKSKRIIMSTIRKNHISKMNVNDYIDLTKSEAEIIFGNGADSGRYTFVGTLLRETKESIRWESMLPVIIPTPEIERQRSVEFYKTKVMPKLLPWG